MTRIHLRQPKAAGPRLAPARRTRPRRPHDSGHATRPAKGHAPQSDSGQATAELALGLPTLSAVVLLALWLLAAAGAQARAQEAARIGARAAARGDDDGRAAAWARLAAPPGATVTISRQADEVTVTVQARLAATGSLLPPAHVTASAVAPVEPATAGGQVEPGGPGEAAPG